MKTDAVFCCLKNKNSDGILDRNRKANSITKKDRDYLLFISVTSCLKKNCFTEFSAELRYIYKRPLASIKDPKIIYFIEKLPADDLANTVSGLPYILIPDGEKPNGIKNNIGDNGN